MEKCCESVTRFKPEEPEQGCRVQDVCPEECEELHNGCPCRVPVRFSSPTSSDPSATVKWHVIQVLSDESESEDEEDVPFGALVDSAVLDAAGIRLAPTPDADTLDAAPSATEDVASVVSVKHTTDVVRTADDLSCNLTDQDDVSFGTLVDMDELEVVEQLGATHLNPRSVAASAKRDSAEPPSSTDREGRTDAILAVRSSAEGLTRSVSGSRQRLPQFRSEMGMPKVTCSGSERCVRHPGGGPWDALVNVDAVRALLGHDPGKSDILDTDQLRIAFGWNEGDHRGLGEHRERVPRLVGLNDELSEDEDVCMLVREDSDALELTAEDPVYMIGDADHSEIFMVGGTRSQFPRSSRGHTYAYAYLGYGRSDAAEQLSKADTHRASAEFWRQLWP